MVFDMMNSFEDIRCRVRRLSSEQLLCVAVLGDELTRDLVDEEIDRRATSRQVISRLVGGVPIRPTESRRGVIHITAKL
jgi:hypothetical protein